MKRYMYLVVIFGLGPNVYGAAYYMKDIWQYVSTRSTENIQMWGVS